MESQTLKSLGASVLPAGRTQTESPMAQRERIHRGRLGLALSGGGFRASLFHIGTLARLAEMDLLRSLECLSTVSGGSIIGAYYYLKVKELFEVKCRDGKKPSRADYIELVREIESDFLEAVQRNIRMRTFLNPIANAKMMKADYSRSDHIAELYNRHFYWPVWEKIRAAEGLPIGSPEELILLKDIKIKPPDHLLPEAMTEHAVIKARDYNATAEFKIPMLNINATCLNSGHLWRFTASSVGEADGDDPRYNDIDFNIRLPRLSFDDTSYSPERRDKLHSLTLADAVAASAAVPGIFPPLSIHDLYEDQDGNPLVVQLSDGGVFDNQGLASLLENQCLYVICSDASGQMSDEADPSGTALNVAMRANDILMERVRKTGFHQLGDAREINALLQKYRPPSLLSEKTHTDPERKWHPNEFAFFHLKSCFENRDDFPAMGQDARNPTDRVYWLARIRTDLDSFSDLEAYSLMYDGYCLNGDFLEKGGDFMAAAELTREEPRGQWNFLAIREEIRNRPEKLFRHLQGGQHKLFKPFRLRDPFQASQLGSYAILLPYLLAIVFVGLLAVPPILWWKYPLPIPFYPLESLSTYWAALMDLRLGRTLQLTLPALGLAALGLWPRFRKWVKNYRFLKRLKNGWGIIASYLLPPLLGALISVTVAFHVYCLDRFFLRNGRLRK